MQDDGFAAVAAVDLNNLNDCSRLRSCRYEFYEWVD